MSGTEAVRVGSRTSALARWQTEQVLAGLRGADPQGSYEFVGVRTAGDGSLRPLYEEGGEGVFTGALETALMRKELDLAVHSFKDVPLAIGSGLAIGAVLQRGNPCDAVVGRALKNLTPGSRVGTSSPRRSAAVRQFRPDLEVVPVRGNVPRRLGLVEAGEVDAVILAAAGLERLGLADRITELLPLELFPPAPAQGAVAVEGRVGEMPASLAALEDPGTRTAAETERALLRRLGGGCGLPLGTYARCALDGTVELLARAWHPDGTRVAETRTVGPNRDVVVEMCFEGLVSQGVRTWWDTIG